jgi:hypothetical protein
MISKNKKQLRLAIELGYLIFIGLLIGGILTLGIFATSVIFHSDIYFLSSILSHYQEGLLMSAIFNKFSLVIMVIIWFIIIYEGYDYKNGKRDVWVMVSAFSAILMALLFVAYYMPIILELQAKGSEATSTTMFQSAHQMSSLSFKLLALSLLSLLGRRLFLMRAS